MKIFHEKIIIFQEDPNNHILKLHPLKGPKMGYYAFSITGDIRIILTLEKNIAVFHDIGTHNQVY